MKMAPRTSSGFAALVIVMLAGCGLPGNRLSDGNAPLPPIQKNEAAQLPTEVETVPPPHEEAPCPPGKGNELDVGLPCTKGGTECDASKSVFCTVNYTDLQPPYCTHTCKTGADCGSGASCMASPTNKKMFVCVPDACVPHGYPTDVTGPELATCLPPNGNSRGIGRPCGSGAASQAPCLAGGQGLQVCSTTVLPQAPLQMCTFLCKTAADCGENMVCAPAPGKATLLVCIPTACLP